MKSKIKSIFLISIILLITCFSLKCYAVTYSSTDVTVESGGNISINVKSSENIQNYDLSLISYDGLNYNGCSSNSEVAVVNSNEGKISYATTGSGTTNLGTYSFRAPEVNTTTKYYVKFDINGVSNTAVVTVKGNNPTPAPDPTPEPPKDPTFKDVNLTMYSTGDINLRASWSTSSQATGIDKGTELNVTGTSTDKVNGYVWYRVNYNGTTKYVASNLLTNTKPEENTDDKSNNTNLKTLTIEGVTLTPEFSPQTTVYNVEVGKDITKLNIKAEPEDEKSTISIQGNDELKDGENVVSISVSAEDGTIKIYEIKVTKNTEKTLGLATLKIADTDIEKTFKTDKYNYEIEIRELSKLDITAIANDETATVEILGNEDLQIGENVINIIVTSSDGTEKVNYQITVNKVEVVQKNNTNTLNKEILIYIIIGATLLITLIIVIVYTVKHRNQEDNDFGGNFNYDYYEDEDEDTEESISKKIERLKNNEAINTFETLEELEQNDEDEEQEVEEYEENSNQEEQFEEETEQETYKPSDEYNKYYEEYEDYNQNNKPRNKKGKHF